MTDRSRGSSRGPSRSLPLRSGVLLLVLALLPVPAAAVPLTTGADFLLMTTGARPDGMGQAFSAVADDVNTLSFNPAGLGNIRLPEAGFGYERFLAGIDYNFLGAAVPMGEAGVLGLGYIEMGTAPFNSTADPLAMPGTAQDQAFIAGWGKSFYSLHLGAAVKYIQRRLDSQTGNGMAYDLGLRVKPSPNLTLASSVMNLGPGIQLASLEPLPTLVNLGLAWRAIESPDHRLELALGGTAYLGSNTQSLQAGAEYWYRDSFALRCGYQARSRDTELTTNGLSAGAGVKVDFIQLDYAFQPFNDLGVIHRVSGLLWWDGPWIGGGEPNPPKNVQVQPVKGALEVRWERPQGPGQAFQVTYQPLDGGPEGHSRPLFNPYFRLEHIPSGTIYRFSVRTLNGSVASFPSPDTYAVAPETLPEEEGVGGAGERVSVSSWVKGEVDGVGLHLSWKPDPDSEGYHIYRMSPSGRMVRLTRYPRQGHQVWVTDISGLQGWRWYVTTLSRSRKKEMTLGFFLWFPTPQEQDMADERPRLKLHVEPEPRHRMFLDWGDAAGAEGYTLFVGDEQDGILERWKDFPPGTKTDLVQVPSSRSKILFVVAPKDARGQWSQKSNLSGAEFLRDEP
ncbi:MAG TPA: PorV/PorQ family protein [bacterium]|nr:PorV/PorQ family protein [bacterium]